MIKILFILLISVNMIFGQSLYYDDTNDSYSGSTTGGGLVAKRELTIMMWIKPDAGTTGELLDNAIATRNIYFVYASASHYFQILLYDGATPQDLTWNDWAAGYYDNHWFHIAITFNANTQWARVYINGVEEQSDNTLTGDALRSVDGLLTIGDTGADGFGGYIDEVKFFSVELSSGQIQSEMYNNDYCYTDSCWIYLPFDDCTQGTAIQTLANHAGGRTEVFTITSTKEPAAYSEDNAPTR